jgi:hypothetical protein
MDADGRNPLRDGVPLRRRRLENPRRDNWLDELGSCALGSSLTTGGPPGDMLDDGRISL